MLDQCCSGVPNGQHGLYFRIVPLPCPTDIPAECQEHGYYGMLIRCFDRQWGWRSSRKAENPDKATGWKSTQLRKHTQASRTNVPPKTNHPAKSNPQTNPSEAFQSSNHCAFPSAALEGVFQLSVHELCEAHGGIKGDKQPILKTSNLSIFKQLPFNQSVDSLYVSCLRPWGSSGRLSEHLQAQRPWVAWLSLLATMMLSGHQSVSALLFSPLLMALDPQWTCQLKIGSN